MSGIWEGWTAWKILLRVCVAMLCLQFWEWTNIEKCKHIEIQIVTSGAFTCTRARKCVCTCSGRISKSVWQLHTSLPCGSSNMHIWPKLLPESVSIAFPSGILLGVARAFLIVCCNSDWAPRRTWTRISSKALRNFQEGKTGTVCLVQVAGASE